MPRTSSLPTAVPTFALTLLLATPVLASDKVTPELDRSFARSANGRAQMLVVLAEQADLAGASRLGTKLERGRFVFERLVEVASRTQGPLLAELARRGAPARPFWVTNVVWTEGDSALAESLARRADVARIEANRELVLSPPVVELEPAPASDAPTAIEWNIAKVNADDVWTTLGVTGQGAVIGGQDTGYQWDHPALKGKYRGWDGAGANHNYNWHDAIHTGGSSCGADSPVPCDDNDHGTHTMGTMVGDDGGANQIGMAPGARWIGCRNMNAGVGTPTTYIECFQWFLAPTDLANQNPDPAKAPDVINNSWGCPTDEGCNSANWGVMQTVVENLRTAGIFVAVSAGNDGPSCSTVTTPAAIFDAVFSVGSTTSSDAASSFSSRGPVTVDGSNRMKPDISAPGSSVRSSIPGGGYTSLSGTSMAGPHVAGLVGLLVSAVPAAAGNIDLLEDVIRQSAVHPAATAQICGGVNTNVFPNNTFGAGRIDALAAVQLLLSQADFQTTVTPPSRAVCAPAAATYDIAIGQLGSFAEPVSLAATGNPAGSTVAFDTNPVTPPGSAVLTVTTAAVAAGTSTLTISGTASPSGTIRSDTVDLQVFTAGAGVPSLQTPADAATNVAVRPAFSWAAASGAASYEVEVDDASDFATPLASATVAGTSWTPGADLPSNSLLYWRVQATNPCASALSAVRSFTTTPLPGDCAVGTSANDIYSTDFEAGATGWEASATVNTWGETNARAHSGTLSWRAQDADSTSDQRLVSPAFALPAGQLPLTLQFWNHQSLESRSGGCWDGGMLEISTDGGATFSQITTGLLTDAYDGPLGSGNPAAPAAAWCGDPQDWAKAVVDLAPWAGQTVRLRFRVTTDGTVGRAPDGWYIDDLLVQSCSSITTLFSDGFASGTTSAWSAVAP